MDFTEEFIVKNTYNSCAIEGNSLTLEEVRFLYGKQETPTGEPFTPVVPSAVEGWRFLGWLLDRNFTIPFVDGTVIEGDTDLYEKWANRDENSIQFTFAYGTKHEAIRGDFYDFSTVNF